MNLNVSGSSLLKLTGKLELSKGANIASPIIAIGVSIIISLLVVWPKFSQTLAFRTANEELEVRARGLEEKAVKLAGYDRAELETQLVAVEQMMPSEKSVFTLVSQIEIAAQSSGVILSSVTVNPGNIEGPDKTKPTASATGEAEDANSSKIEVNIAVGSDYKSFLQFISNLLSISRVTSLKDLTVTSSGSNQVKATMNVQAYWQTLPAELPSLETPITELSQAELARLESIEKTGLVAPPSVPEVPIGREDLFAPF